ncbi:MAG: glutamate-5-semialdehyde dehydrogenase [Ruminococcus sp.]|jgi:glutamate-5-semialdehyde dehydrogenase|nr:glutamate-5-semialdehyde dehydrogenase [Ruminococcus sp.]
MEIETNATHIQTLGTAAKSAVKKIMTASTLQKDKALSKIAEKLSERQADIINANEADLENADRNGMSESLKDRLRLNSARIKGICDSIKEVIALPDPVGKIDGGSVRPNGMKIEKVRVPIGVIGIIYESRPNVTVDAAVLCLKSGNCCILRGGKEAYNSNKLLCEIMREALTEAGLPADIIGFIDDVTRESTNELMKSNEYIDLLIPRGSASLINAVVKNATVPIIETGVGNCHLFVDADADLDMAAQLTVNSKCRRVSVCNAIESLLVHRDAAFIFLPKIKDELDRFNVELRGDLETRRILGDSIKEATETDYATEFLDYILSVKVVKSVDEAIEHIDKYSSKHSECIVTNNLKNAEKFTSEVDSAAVYVNVATSFTDGGMFGLGAEIGISTQKMHARGPMGLNELTTTKYIITGNGQIRA